MVNDFLKKYQEELISQKIQLKEDIDLLETKIKEETKFLSVLEESNESYFKEFTPRDLNAKNNEKAVEVRENLKVLNAQMDELTTNMKFYDGRLVEVNALINNTAVINRPSNNTNNTEFDVNNFKNELLNKLNDIKNIIILDPYRANIELEKLISSIEKH